MERHLLPPAAVLPAAGAARRMGRPKLLLPWAGGTLIGGVVRALQDGGAYPLVVVARSDDLALQEWVRGEGLELAVNPRPEEGMLSSVRCGLTALGGADRMAADGVPLLVSPADLPELLPETVRRLVAVARQRRALLALPRHGSRRGHPLWIAPQLLAAILGLDPAVGLRQLLRQRAADVVEVPVDDPGAVRDVDTPEDYAAGPAD
ncbi:MAG TPA: nucleotidyltransferase family protein [Thermoanaerobaculia bacterium]|nr:nucleotidyltransferase family protein [Thermoanaerobaculia bacterium]